MFSPDMYNVRSNHVSNFAMEPRDSPSRNRGRCRISRRNAASLCWRANRSRTPHNNAALADAMPAKETNDNRLAVSDTGEGD